MPPVSLVTISQSLLLHSLAFPLPEKRELLKTTKEFNPVDFSDFSSPLHHTCGGRFPDLQAFSSDLQVGLCWRCSRALQQGGHLRASCKCLFTQVNDPEEDVGLFNTGNELLSPGSQQHLPEAALILTSATTSCSVPSRSLP